MKHIIALAGMPGSGKSLVTAYFSNSGYPKVRFGQFTIDEIARRGLAQTQANEKLVREDLRKRLGMAGYCTYVIPKVDEHLKEHDVVILDGLYSFSEYKLLREEYGEQLTVIAIFTPRHVRYHRLGTREERPLTPEEALARDFAEIENIEKGGPIAIADYTIVNDGTPEQLIRRADELVRYVMEAS